MATLCSPSSIIKHSKPRTETMYEDGDTGDIIETILVADAESSEYVDVSGVECLRGRNDQETLENVWAFVRHNLTYRPDRRGHEQVKKPGPLFYSGVGDCKSFSIATGAILRALGYPYRYRFAAYKPGDVTHVYVVAKGRNGKDIVLDSVHDQFNDEVRYFSKRDIAPTAAQIGGIGTIKVDFTKIAFTALAGIIIWNLIKK